MAESPYVLQVFSETDLLDFCPECWHIHPATAKLYLTQHWKGMCILFTAVLKPDPMKSFPRALNSVLLNIPPTLQNDYQIQGVISSWSYYNHPPWQSNEKNTQFQSIRKSRFKTLYRDQHKFIQISMQQDQVLSLDTEMSVCQEIKSLYFSNQPLRGPTQCHSEGGTAWNAGRKASDSSTRTSFNVNFQILACQNMVKHRNLMLSCHKN